MNTETVLALAPDTASAQAARKLAGAAHWSTLNAAPGSLWGECQGSGSKPYLVGIDLRTPDYACKCSCPSRKFPCKHGLALLLLHVNGVGNWGTAALPEVLSKWLDGRQARQDASAEPDAKPAKAVDPAAKAKREAARHGKITGGLEDLHLWLQDLVREGLAAARTLPYRTWDAQAARLIDAQAPGAARLVRQIPEVLHGDTLHGDERGEALLAHLGRLALLCEGWALRDTLSGPERLQLQTVLGQPLDSAALLAGEGQAEEWAVMGGVQETEGKLEVRRTWLRRVQGGEAALILDFAPTGRGFAAPPLPHLHTARMDLRFVPTLHPQRALLAGAAEVLKWRPELPDLPAASIADLYRAYAGALAQNPWLERIACSVGPVRVLPHSDADAAQAQDTAGHALPLTGVDPYTLLAQARGGPLHLYGEWDGRAFWPLLWQAAALEGQA